MVKKYIGPGGYYHILCYSNFAGEVEATVLPTGVQIMCDDVHGPAWSIRWKLKCIQHLYPNLPITIIVDMAAPNPTLNTALERFSPKVTWTDGRFSYLELK